MRIRCGLSPISTTCIDLTDYVTDFPFTTCGHRGGIEIPIEMSPYTAKTGGERI